MHELNDYRSSDFLLIVNYYIKLLNDQPSFGRVVNKREKKNKFALLCTSIIKRSGLQRWVWVSSSSSSSTSVN